MKNQLCTDERKAEILQEIRGLLGVTYKDDNWIVLNKNGIWRVFYEKLILKKDHWHGYSYNTGQNFYDKPLKITKLLLEISEDWTELCFELPKYKAEFVSDVMSINHDYEFANGFSHQHYLIKTTYKDMYTRDRELVKAKATLLFTDKIKELNHKYDWVVSSIDSTDKKYSLLWDIDIDRVGGGVAINDDSRYLYIPIEYYFCQVACDEMLEFAEEHIEEYGIAFLGGSYD